MPDKLKDFGYVYLIMAPDVGAMKGGKAEAYLHRTLRRYHLHGEWFRARPMVVAWLRDLLSIGYGAPACACRRCRKLWV